MKTWKKVVIGVVVAGALMGIVLFSVHQANKGVVTVQTAKVANQDELVSLVTASGEIKPTTYTNVTAQGFGMENPISHPPGGQQGNRRVELRITSRRVR